MVYKLYSEIRLKRDINENMYKWRRWTITEIWNRGEVYEVEFNPEDWSEDFWFCSVKAEDIELVPDINHNWEKER